MNAGLPPPSLAMVIADTAGTVDANPETVDSKTARVPASMLKEVADIVVTGWGGVHCLAEAAPML